MPTTPTIGDVYTELQEFADQLWDLYQSMDTDATGADQAHSMYSTLENVYLEPIRRQIYQMDSQALAAATAKLDSTTAGIAKTIDDIANIIQATKQIDQYAKVFDGVISVAAQTLTAVAA